MARKKAEPGWQERYGQEKRRSRPKKEDEIVIGPGQMTIWDFLEPAPAPGAPDVPPGGGA